jgi:integrase
MCTPTLRAAIPESRSNRDCLRQLRRSFIFWPLQVKAGVIRLREGQGREVAEAKYILHALRHAAAALFIQQGFSAKKVQTIMGHASIQMTYDVYGYLLDRAEDDGEAMAQMQRRLLG